MERFWSKVKKSEGCWEWQGSKNTDGYGGFRIEGKTVGAHRVAYTLIKGPIPEGMVVMHSCDNPACVNPDHLSVGTNMDNMKDRDTKGRHHNTQKTRCPQGHEYTEENTHRRGKGRSCRVCRHVRSRVFAETNRDHCREYTREWQRKYRERNREALREYDRARYARKKAEKEAQNDATRREIPLPDQSSGLSPGPTGPEENAQSA